ncbi:ATP-binding protein [Dehalogenimonas alkenigignens]|uniref:ATP-binding protein n=1 Tax=Dehalogenimonas alkenigignens TaxID=1217799 RepID=UPI000D588A3A|nr:ATP-binding protein [Dehalogenimonas alkenigignens]PVV84485.1 hypothetical protein DD509_04115 [Dehalogenimonas alkenigignens]
MHLFGMVPEYVKRLIKDTIETYSGQWRIIHEAVQNSHDHIQLNERISRGEIVIDFKIGTNEIEVRDNGTGIPYIKYPVIFNLGGTDKKQPELRSLLKGSQGVGLKATVFTSNYFEVETSYNGGKWKTKVENAWNFEDPSFDDEISEPILQDNDTSRTGTIVRYSLHDYSVREFLNDVTSEYCDHYEVDYIESEATLIRCIENYFRTQTYLGCVKMLLGVAVGHKPITIKLNLIFNYPTLAQHQTNVLDKCSFLGDDTYHGRVISMDFSASYIDYKTEHEKLPRGSRVDVLYNHISNVIENPPDPNRKKILIQKLTSDQAKMLLSKVVRNDGTARLVHDETKLEKHARILEKLNGIYLVVGPRTYLKTHLLLYPQQIISVNGLPTNINISTPTGAGESGYLLNIHFIMDVNTTLGYGKRNIPGVVKGQIDSFFRDAFSMVLRRVAKAVVGERDSTDPVPDVWRKEVAFQKYEDIGNPFKTAGLPTKEIPVEEQDVICLFNQLVGRGLLKGYYPFYTSSCKTYDSLMYISNQANGNMPDRINWADLKVVEYKLKLSELIQDFIEEKKYLQTLDLAIVWENDYTEEDYIVSSLERDGITGFPCAQKRIRSGPNSCQLLVLKEFLGM